MHTLTCGHRPNGPSTRSTAVPLLRDEEIFSTLKQTHIVNDSRFSPTREQKTRLAGPTMVPVKKGQREAITNSGSFSSSANPEVRNLEPAAVLRNCEKQPGISHDETQVNHCMERASALSSERQRCFRLSRPGCQAETAQSPVPASPLRLWLERLLKVGCSPRETQGQ
jgi:hypothetical protein